MRNLFSFFIFLLSLNCFSQVLKTTQNMTIIDGIYKIEYNGTYFDIDTTTLTIKVIDLNAISSDYDVIRKNKLGFVDVKKPLNITIGDFVMLLSQDETVELIIYSTYGIYFDVIPNDTYVDSLWHLPAGMYFVKITTEAGEVTKKIVKQ